MADFRTFSIDKHFEGIRIFCPEMKVSISDVSDNQMPEATRFTSVSHGMISSGSNANKNVKGLVLVILRNQGGDKKQAIFIEGEFAIIYADQGTSSEAFIKALQYLFKWTKEYAKENNVTDSTGVKFQVPQFLYSKDQFFFP